MKIVLCLLALVAVSTGRRVPTVERQGPPAGSLDPAGRPNGGQPDRPGKGPSKRPNVPAPSQPLEMTPEELFTFPGSSFVEELFTQMLEMPVPQDPSFLGASWDPDVEGLEDTMFDLYEYFGEWTGIPSMVTMKMTTWLAEKIFTCPSVVFDKIFVKSVYENLEGEFTSFGGTVYDYFETVTRDLFPDMEESWYETVATEATTEIITSIMDDVLMEFFSRPLRDIAQFSHSFYDAFVEAAFSYDEDEPEDFLEQIMTKPELLSIMRCPVPSEAQKFNKNAIAKMTNTLKMKGETFWMKIFERFFMNLVPVDQKESVTLDENTMKSLATAINKFEVEVLEMAGQYEKTVDSPNNSQAFLEETLGDGYSDFITVLLDQMQLDEAESIMEKARKRLLRKTNYIFA